MTLVRSRNQLIVGLVALVGILVSSAGVGYVQTRRLFQHSALVAHTHEVLASLGRVMADLTDAETSQRAFVITGDESYLDIHDAVRRDFPANLLKLKGLTADNPRQQQRIVRLDALSADRLAILAEGIKLQRTGQIDAARDLIVSGRGRSAMQATRSLVAEMQQDQRELLAIRDRENDSVYEAALLSGFVALLFGLAAVGAFVWLLTRYVRAMAMSSSLVHEQRELLRAMLASIGDGVIATDLQGRVTFLNLVAQSLTGWTQELASGLPLEQVFQIVNEASRMPVENPAIRAMREGRIVGLANHTLLVSRDGTEWPIDDSAAVVRNEQGQVAGAILVFREIRERKQQEAELKRQAAALLEADRRKDEFLSILAHELRNPLAPISNALQVWRFVENDQTQMRQLHEIMGRQVQQMTRLIDDLLDVSRITRGKIELRKEPVLLAAAISGAVEAARPLLDSAEHELVIEIEDDSLLIEGDNARLTQIFGNILQSAAKFTARQGKIVIRARRHENEAVVAIRDNGPGIPVPMLSRIFEMFQQVDQSVERSNCGLGIGLTLVKRLVELHGGRVEAHSEGPGEGSEFVVTLPLMQSPTSKVAAGETEINNGRHWDIPHSKVLIVDDVRASAKTLALMLQAIGQQVEVLHDGAAAVDWVLEHRPEFVFLDIAMPGMSGYEVARQIRARAELRDVVLVALTGYGQEEDRRRTKEAGFDEHLTKPTSIEQLHEVLLRNSRHEQVK